MSQFEGLQQLLFDAISAHVAELGGRVYDNVPEGAAFPYASFGLADYTPLDLDCMVAGTTAFQIDIWSRDSAQGRECRRITDQVRKACNGLSALAFGAAIHRIRVTQTRIFRDADGITWHGVVSVETEVAE